MENDLENLPMFITAPEIACLLNVSRSKAYTLLRTDGFPAVKFGKTVRVPRDSFIMWLNALEQKKM